MAADIYKVLRGIKGMQGEPVIIFSFARRWLGWLLYSMFKDSGTSICTVVCCL